MNKETFAVGQVVDVADSVGGIAEVTITRIFAAHFLGTINVSSAYDNKTLRLVECSYDDIVPSVASFKAGYQESPDGEGEF